MTGRMPGSKPLSRRDWLFGSRPRRLLLEHTLRAKPPAGGWTKSALARAADVSVHGGVDEHVAGLERLELLISAGGLWLPARPRPPLARALVQVTQLLRVVPDQAPSAGTTRGTDPLDMVRREVRRARNAIERASELEPDVRQAALDAVTEAERALA